MVLHKTVAALLEIASNQLLWTKAAFSKKENLFIPPHC